MTGNHGEAVRESPGFAQIVADKAVKNVEKLVEVYPFLRDHGALMKASRELRLLSSNPEVALEEVQQAYDTVLLPRLQQVREEVESGAIVALKRNAFRRMQEPKTFEELVETVETEIQSDENEEAKDCAVDSIIMGDIELREIFLPYQKEIRARVLAQLRAADYHQGEGEDMEVVDGEEVIVSESEETALRALPFKKAELKAMVEAQKLDEKIAHIIFAARDDIREQMGASQFKRTPRIIAIRRAHLGNIHEREWEKAHRRTGKAINEDPFDIGEMLSSLAAVDLMEAPLADREERVVRMRYGLSQEGDAPIERKEMPASVKAHLAFLEIEALERTAERIPLKRFPRGHATNTRNFPRIVREDPEDPKDPAEE